MKQTCQIYLFTYKSQAGINYKCSLHVSRLQKIEFFKCASDVMWSVLSVLEKLTHFFDQKFMKMPSNIEKGSNAIWKKCSNCQGGSKAQNAFTNVKTSTPQITFLTRCTYVNTRGVPKLKTLNFVSHYPVSQGNDTVGACTKKVLWALFHNCVS